MSTFIKPPLPFSPYLKVDWRSGGAQETLYLKSVVQARDAELLRAVAEYLDGLAQKQPNIGALKMTLYVVRDQMRKAAEQ